MSTIEENFDRLFSLVGSLAEITAKNTGDITRIESSVQNLIGVSTAHQQTLELYKGNFERVIERLDINSADIREMQTEVRELQTEVKEIVIEVRGLRTETRRILDQLINREGDSQ